jgi:hypothetical protein
VSLRTHHGQHESSKAQNLSHSPIILQTYKQNVSRRPSLEAPKGDEQAIQCSGKQFQF